MEHSDRALHARNNERKRVLVVGAKGLLGQRIVEVLRSESQWTVFAGDRNQITVVGSEDVVATPSSTDDWQHLFDTTDWRPDVIINCAAFTNVDECESRRDLAWSTNVELVEKLAKGARKSGAKLVQISTDYIFDGKHGPYKEEDIPNPVNYYGKTKLAAENVCRQEEDKNLIIRTMWLYGSHTGGKSTFVDWVEKELGNNRQISIVDDEIGTSTLTDDLAYACIQAISTDLRGVIHIAGPELTSRFELAQQIADVFGYDKKNLHRITTSKLQRKAIRPLQSGLIATKAHSLLGSRMSSNREGLVLVRTEKQRGETNMSVLMNTK